MGAAVEKKEKVDKPQDKLANMRLDQPADELSPWYTNVDMKSGRELERKRARKAKTTGTQREDQKHAGSSAYDESVPVREETPRRSERTKASTEK